MSKRLSLRSKIGSLLIGWGQKLSTTAQQAEAVKPLEDIWSASKAPPEHWLKMVQDQAPQLLEGKKYSVTAHFKSEAESPKSEGVPIKKTLKPLSSVTPKPIVEAGLKGSHFSNANFNSAEKGGRAVPIPSHDSVVRDEVSVPKRQKPSFNLFSRRSNNTKTKDETLGQTAAVAKSSPQGAPEFYCQRPLIAPQVTHSDEPVDVINHKHDPSFLNESSSSELADGLWSETEHVGIHPQSPSSNVFSDYASVMGRSVPEDIFVGHNRCSHSSIEPLAECMDTDPSTLELRGLTDPQYVPIQAPKQVVNTSTQMDNGPNNNRQAESEGYFGMEAQSEKSYSASPEFFQPQKSTLHKTPNTDEQSIEWPILDGELHTENGLWPPLLTDNSFPPVTSTNKLKDVELQYFSARSQLERRGELWNA